MAKHLNNHQKMFIEKLKTGRNILLSHSRGFGKTEFISQLKAKEIEVVDPEIVKNV
jgi:hypothetical protein